MSLLEHHSDGAGLVVASRIARAGDSSAFYRAVRAGGFVKLAVGVYVARSMWEGMGPDDRHRARIRATAIAHDRDLVFSHFSAAALWGLPMVSAWPARVEVVEQRSSGGRSRTGLLSHGDGVPTDVETRGGLATTTLARTLVDVARTGRFSAAVAMADHVLPAARDRTSTAPAGIITLDLVASELAVHPSSYARARAERVLAFADGAAESPGESLSRVGIHLLGFPPPVLQQVFVDEHGMMYPDFWWPDFGVADEFDGAGKYLRAEFLRGRSTSDALMMEKAREDRLRALGPRVVRWGWDTARSLPRLDHVLRTAGLRPVRPRLVMPR